MMPLYTLTFSTHLLVKKEFDKNSIWIFKNLHKNRLFSAEKMPSTTMRLTGQIFEHLPVECIPLSWNST